MGQRLLVVRAQQEGNTDPSFSNWFFYCYFHFISLFLFFFKIILKLIFFQSIKLRVELGNKSILGKIQSQE